MTLLRPLAALGFFAVLLSAGTASAIPLRNLQFRAQVNEFPVTAPNTNYSSCWSYVHHDGREYAAIGVGDGGGTGADEGTAIYNVTNPAAPYRVAFIPGPPSIWREMKQYRNWLYVVTEGTGATPAEGVQIIRMTNPESPVLVATYVGNFHRSHTVSVDTTRALLVTNGTRRNVGDYISYPASGMRILSLANPEAPVELSTWPASITAANEDLEYVHDSVPIGNRLYASSIYPGIQRVFDFTNPSNPVQIASWHYTGGFTHNAWPDKTGNWLYVTDELNGEPLKIFDISNLSEPKLFNTWTANSDAIVHNAHVWGDDLFLAHYTEGIRVLDARDPGHPAEFAYADTWEGNSGDYHGVWEVAAFPSGTVIASDRTSGLWIFTLQRNYGTLKVRVRDAGTGQVIPDVKLFRGAAAESVTTTSDGVGVFALDPGSHTITAKCYGYQDGSVVHGATVGSRDSVVVLLQAKPTVSFGGVVRNAANQAALDEAEVILAYGPLHDHTDGTGQYNLPAVPEGFHRVEVRRPGFVPMAFNRQIGPGPATMTFQLTAAPVWNPIESSAGWVVGGPGDNATANQQGVWTHADPLGTTLSSEGHAARRAVGEYGLQPDRDGAALAHEGHHEAEGLGGGPFQPDDDRTPSGTLCFVTGNGAVPSDIDGHDLDGRTTLTSPTLNATGMTIPTIGFWRWFYTSAPGNNDYFQVLISNDGGANWVAAITEKGVHDHWQEISLRIADYVPPTSQIKVRFVAVDGGGSSVVEAAIDDLTLYDASTQPVGAFPEPAPERVAFRRVWPNPAPGAVQAVLDLPRNARVAVDVLDVTGRRVATVIDRELEAGPVAIAWNGRTAAGESAGPGVYFFRARVGAETITARFATVR